MARASIVRDRSNRKRADEHTADILCLRARGLSFPAIAAALAHFREADLTHAQVEYVCRGREAPNPNMARVSA